MQMSGVSRVLPKIKSAKMGMVVCALASSFSMAAVAGTGDIGGGSVTVNDITIRNDLLGDVFIPAGTPREYAELLRSRTQAVRTYQDLPEYTLMGDGPSIAQMLEHLSQKIPGFYQDLIVANQKTWILSTDPIQVEEGLSETDDFRYVCQNQSLSVRCSIEYWRDPKISPVQRKWMIAHELIKSWGMVRNISASDTLAVTKLWYLTSHQKTMFPSVFVRNLQQVGVTYGAVRLPEEINLDLDLPAYYHNSKQELLVDGEIIDSEVWSGVQAIPGYLIYTRSDSLRVYSARLKKRVAVEFFDKEKGGPPWDLSYSEMDRFESRLTVKPTQDDPFLFEVHGGVFERGGTAVVKYRGYRNLFNFAKLSQDLPEVSQDPRFAPKPTPAPIPVPASKEPAPPRKKRLLFF